MKWILVFIIVACTVASDVMQTGAMRQHGEITDFDPRSLGRSLRAVASRWPLILSIACMALSFFVFLHLLEIADLSFSVPATALTYVVDALFARYAFHEHFSPQRWTGILMIAAGVLLLAW